MPISSPRTEVWVMRLTQRCCNLRMLGLIATGMGMGMCIKGMHKP